MKADNNYLDSILDSGKKKQLQIAEPVLKEVYEIIGFLSK